MEWDGNDLIGAFSATRKSNVLRSIYTGGSPYYSYNPTITDIESWTKSRGQGYSLVRWEHHCIMAFLFFAMYGNTNSQTIIGNGSNSTKVGSTANLGMQDTQGGTDDVNFWGLERWWGCSELLENVRSNMGSINKIMQVTMRDGTTRNLDITPNDYGNKYCNKIAIGPYLDIVCTQAVGTSTTGYCDVLAIDISGDALNGYAYRSYSTGTQTGITCSRGDSLNNSYYRIAFYGNIIEEKNPPKFIAL